MTQAARPKSMRTLSSSESAALLDRLADYRAPFGTPIAMAPNGIVRSAFWQGTKGDLLPGEMSAPVLIQQTLAAGLFIFIEAQGTAVPTPRKFGAMLVRPESVRTFMDLHPASVLFAAPPGYLSDGRPL